MMIYRAYCELLARAFLVGRFKNSAGSAFSLSANRPIILMLMASPIPLLLNVIEVGLRSFAHARFDAVTILGSYHSTARENVMPSPQLLAIFGRVAGTIFSLLKTPMYRW